MPVATVIPLRPGARPVWPVRPHPVRSRPGRRRPVRPRPPFTPPVVSPVRVDWDGPRGVYVAVCERCCETVTTGLLDEAEEWADHHRCDPELAALLADITGEAA